MVAANTSPMTEASTSAYLPAKPSLCCGSKTVFKKDSPQVKYVREYL
jgi:hypothetical protein